MMRVGGIRIYQGKICYNQLDPRHPCPKLNFLSRIFGVRQADLIVLEFCRQRHTPASPT